MLTAEVAHSPFRCQSDAAQTVVCTNGQETPATASTVQPRLAVGVWYVRTGEGHRAGSQMPSGATGGTR